MKTSRLVIAVGWCACIAVALPAYPPAAAARTEVTVPTPAYPSRGMTLAGDELVWPRVSTTDFWDSVDIDLAPPQGPITTLQHANLFPEKARSVAAGASENLLAYAIDAGHDSTDSRNMRYLRSQNQLFAGPIGGPYPLIEDCSSTSASIPAPWFQVAGTLIAYSNCDYSRVIVLDRASGTTRSFATNVFYGQFASVAKLSGRLVAVAEADTTTRAPYDAVVSVRDRTTGSQIYRARPPAMFPRGPVSIGDLELQADGTLFVTWRPEPVHLPPTTARYTPRAPRPSVLPEAARYGGQLAGGELVFTSGPELSLLRTNKLRAPRSLAYGTCDNSPYLLDFDGRRVLYRIGNQTFVQAIDEPAAGTQPPDGFCSVRFPRTTIKATRSGRLLLPVACSAAERRGCKVTLGLFDSDATPFFSKDATLRRGRTAKVPLRIPRYELRQLTKRREISILVKVSTQGRTDQQSELTLVVPSRRAR